MSKQPLDEETRNDIHEYFPALAEKKAIFQLAKTISLPALEDIDLDTDTLDSPQWNNKWKASSKALHRLDDLEFTINQPITARLMRLKPLPTNIFLEPPIFLDDNLPSKPDKWDWKEKSRHFPLLAESKHDDQLSLLKKSNINSDGFFDSLETSKTQASVESGVRKIQYKVDVIQKLASLKRPPLNRTVNLTALSTLKSKLPLEVYGTEIEDSHVNDQRVHSYQALMEEKPAKRTEAVMASIHTRSMSATVVNKNDIFQPQRHLEEFQSLQQQQKKKLNNNATIGKKRIDNGNKSSCRQTSRECELDGRRRFKFD